LHFLPWGMDHLGTDRNMFWSRDFDPPKSVKADSAIPRRLYRHPEARKDYFKAMEKLIHKTWKEEELIAQIDALQKMIDPYRVDRGEWVNQKTDAFKKFIQRRREEVLGEFADGKTPDWTLDQRPLMSELVKVADSNGSFSLKMGDGEKGDFGFVSAHGTSKITVKWGKEKLDFGQVNYGVRKNGRHSVTLRISSEDTPEGKPTAIEINFPQKRLDDGDGVPYRLDIFASPAQGNVFADGSQEPIGNLAGRVVVTRFGTEPGDKIEGRLESEVFRFLPPKEE